MLAGRFITLELTAVYSLTHDTRIFRFKQPAAAAGSGGARGAGGIGVGGGGGGGGVQAEEGFGRHIRLGIGAADAVEASRLVSHTLLYHYIVMYCNII